MGRTLGERGLDRLLPATQRGLRKFANITNTHIDATLRRLQVRKGSKRADSGKINWNQKGRDSKDETSPARPGDSHQGFMKGAVRDEVAKKACGQCAESQTDRGFTLEGTMA